MSSPHQSDTELIAQPQSHSGQGGNGQLSALYVTAEFSPAQTAVAVRAQFHVAAMRNAAMVVHVLSGASAANAAPWDTDPELTQVRVALASNQAGLKHRLIAEFRLGFSLGWAAVKRRQTYQIAVLSSPPFFANIIVAMALRLVGKPYVIDVRDRYPQVLFSVGVLRPSSFAGRILLLAERWLYAGSVCVTTVTNSLAGEILHETRFSPSVIRNGYDADAFAHQSEIDVSKVDPPTIIMHGLFGQLFDADAFIKIARYCEEHAPPHSFVLAGYGPKLQKLKEQNLSNVVDSGHLTHKAVVQLLRNATLGLSIHSNQPSTMAGFAVKVFEFIGAGIPSIVIPRGEAGLEIEANGFGWSFSNDDWQGAAQVIVSVMEKRESLSDIERALMHSRQRYARQTQAVAFANIVKRCVETQKRS